MSWDSGWETVFARRDWGRYPSEELVRFVARVRRRMRRMTRPRVLEIGCGTGANLWMLAREGWRVVGMDASPSALAKARGLLARERFRCTLVLGDVERLGVLFPPASFDLVVDVACVQHNELRAARRIAEGVRRVLRPGGWFFTMQLSNQSRARALVCGRQGESAYRVPVGADEQPVRCRTIGLPALRRLLTGFQDLDIEYVVRSQARRREMLASWVVAARRP